MSARAAPARLPRRRRAWAAWAAACLAAWSAASAHTEPVRAYMLFPTVSGGTLDVRLVGADSGAFVSGARLELTVSGPVRASAARLEEVGPGVYRFRPALPAGEYEFELGDRTVPGETLSQRVRTRLPRPADASVYAWDWPATRGAPAGQGLGAALGGLAAVTAAFAAVIAIVSRRRARRPD